MFSGIALEPMSRRGLPLWHTEPPPLEQNPVSAMIRSLKFSRKHALKLHSSRHSYYTTALLHCSCCARALLCCSYYAVPIVLMHCYTVPFTSLNYNLMPYSIWQLFERFCYRKNGLGVNKELPFYSTSVIFQSFVLKNFFLLPVKVSQGVSLILKTQCGSLVYQFI